MIVKEFKIYEVGLDALSCQLANMAKININFANAILLAFFEIGGCLTLDEYLYCLEIDNIKNTFELNLDLLSNYYD